MHWSPWPAAAQEEHGGGGARCAEPAVARSGRSAQEAEAERAGEEATSAGVVGRRTGEGRAAVAVQQRCWRRQQSDRAEDASTVTCWAIGGDDVRAEKNKGEQAYGGRTRSAWPLSGLYPDIVRGVYKACMAIICGRIWLVYNHRMSLSDHSQGSVRPWYEDCLACWLVCMANGLTIV